MRTQRQSQRVAYIRRRMFVRAAALLLFIAISAMSGMMLHANAMSGGAEPTDANEFIASAVSYKAIGTERDAASLLAVEPGDTLLSIAERYAPEGVGKKQYAREIMEMNGMDTAGLQVGQVLRLP